jgi:beta-glucosidase
MNTHSANRRDFLKTTAQTATAAFALGRSSLCLAENPAPKAPLPRPPFYWGVGIENCWIAQCDPQKDGNRRLLDVFLQMQHYEKWKEDLDLVKHVGFNAIRYSAPWYKTEPKPGVYDWSWLDGPIEYLVNKLKIIPIMDLIHYGTPAWMADGVIDDRFPDAIARYAEAMAAHYRGLVNHYSPHNEPNVTCGFCGLSGRWPPYRKSIADWAKIGVAVAKGMVLEMEAIRRQLADAVIVSVDPFFFGHLQDLPLPELKDKALRRDVNRAAAFYPASLAYGKVGLDHPFAKVLRECKVPEADIEWFQNRAAKPDIVGCNSYPAIVRPKPEELTGGQDWLTVAAKKAGESVRFGLLETHEYFGQPVYLTETSSGLNDEEKVAYIRALYEMIRELRQKKIPVVGVNWWPLFETIQWDYRENPDKPLKDFIVPGGWNNGLYVTKPDASGDLKRIPTPAVEAFQEIMRKEI